MESQPGVPVLDTTDVFDRKALADKIAEHKDHLALRRVDEERRLLYVALTRCEHTLLVSGHHWGPTESKPRGPSDFLLELKSIIEASAQAGDPCGVIDHWAPDPADGEPNPLRNSVVEATWPAEPTRRAALDRGAELVQRADASGPVTAADVENWTADVDALLAERARAHEPESVPLPGQLSVSMLVELGKDRAAATQRLRRRLPVRPDPHALLGTAFHDWVQRFFRAERLFDLDDLPGAVDGDAGRADAEELAELQAAFASSVWAARTPLDVEVPFDMMIGATVVRGRVDAVFDDGDGTQVVVDWKTGDVPGTPEAQRHAAVQLAVYRLAWAGMTGRPLESVRAAFHYVRSGVTARPDELAGPDELAALLKEDDYELR